MISRELKKKIESASNEIRDRLLPGVVQAVMADSEERVDSCFRGIHEACIKIGLRIQEERDGTPEEETRE